MSDRSKVSQVDVLNRKLEAAFCRPYHDYDCVQVCTIYWKDNDNDGFRTEAEDFKTFIETELKYPVQIIEIPTHKPQLFLDEQINLLLRSLQGESNLLVIHYGGHGDPDDDKNKNQTRRSIWAARRQGGPTINWSTIQEKFRSDDTNVLLFIDCCFAAQAARDPERLVPHKVELLAAAGMGTETVPPGPGSFTTACIREMRYLICEHGYISISDLNTRLTRKEACLSVTPFHVFIKSGYGDRSIRLYPCDQGSSQVVAVRHPEAALKLLVFLKEKSLPTMSEFVKQLVDDLHPDVAGIVVDEYVTGAERVQESFPDQLPKAQKRRSETWKPQLGQRYTLEQERESAFSVRKAHLNPSASVAAALDQVTYLLGKLTPALEFIEHTCSSKPQTTKSNKPLQWLSRLSTMEEDVKSFQLEQRNCNEPMNTIQEKSCVMRCKEKTTEQWIAEDVGTVQEEDVEEGAEDDEEQEENDVLSMYPTTTPARKQETLRSIYRTDSLDKDFQSSEGASSDYTRTPSDYTIKPTCATTSSNPTRTPSLTYSVSGHSLEIEGRVRSTDALPEYAEKGEDKISRILAGIHITDSGSAVLYEDIEDDCLKK